MELEEVFITIRPKGSFRIMQNPDNKKCIVEFKAPDNDKFGAIPDGFVDYNYWTLKPKFTRLKAATFTYNQAKTIVNKMIHSLESPRFTIRKITRSL